MPISPLATDSCCNTHAIWPSWNSGSILSPLMRTPKVVSSGRIDSSMRTVSFGPSTRKLPVPADTAFSKISMLRNGISLRIREYSYVLKMWLCVRKQNWILQGDFLAYIMAQKYIFLYINQIENDLLRCSNKPFFLLLW